MVCALIVAAASCLEPLARASVGDAIASRGVRMAEVAARVGIVIYARSAAVVAQTPACRTPLWGTGDAGASVRPR
jgi:hypothetical protein